MSSEDKAQDSLLVEETFEVRFEDEEEGAVESSGGGESIPGKDTAMKLLIK